MDDWSVGNFYLNLLIWEIFPCLIYTFYVLLGVIRRVCFGEAMEKAAEILNRFREERFSSSLRNEVIPTELKTLIQKVMFWSFESMTS